VHSAGALATRPRKRPGYTTFPVADELLLLPPEGENAIALNKSGAVIWDLCDGLHTLFDMLHALRARYEGDDVVMLADLSEALLRFHRLGLIEGALPSLGGAERMSWSRQIPAEIHRPRVRFVFGIEDRPYFHWQLAILFESLSGQLPNGWDVTVVVCNDHADLSAVLERLFDIYGVRALTGLNHAHSHDIDLSAGHGGYAMLNKVEALKTVGAYVEADDIVCLMDTDLFLVGDLQQDLFPAENSLAANRTIGEKPFMGFGCREGIDLQQVLGALGCERKFKPGGVTVFMTGDTVSNSKVIRDCFRFAQILHLMAKVTALPEHNTWMAEMPCFALALTANGVDYDLLDTPQFAVPDPQQERLPEGSFFHYYVDVNDGAGGPFLGSEWYKQLFRERDFLLEDIESFRSGAGSDLERRFLELAMTARRRLHDGIAS
jgi:hypothetical protein